MSREFSRTDRVGSQLQRELAVLIRDELSDKRLGMVTVHEVRVSRDLSHAKVFFTFMGSELSPRDCVRALNHAAGFLRRLLGQRLTLRLVPELHFTLDESIERGMKLTKLIDEAQPRTPPDAD